MGRVAIGLVLLGCVGCVACATDSDEVNRERCEQLRDHVIELRLAGVEVSPATPMPNGNVLAAPQSSKIDIEQHRATLKRALGEGFVSACQKNLTKRQLSCELAVKDLASLTSCLGEGSGSQMLK